MKTKRNVENYFPIEFVEMQRTSNVKDFGLRRLKMKLATD